MKINNSFQYDDLYILIFTIYDNENISSNKICQIIKLILEKIVLGIIPIKYFN